MDKIDALITHSLNEAKQTLDTFISHPETVANIGHAADVIATALANNKKIISCGNGGSLCDATHFAEELTGRYRENRRPLPAIAINDPAYMTCVANDFDYEEIFARYVESVGQEGDVLLAISTSGESANVLKSALMAKERNMKVVALTREGKNQLSELADVTIAAPHALYADRIQEIHIKVIHILIESVETIMKQT